MKIIFSATGHRPQHLTLFGGRIFDSVDNYSALMNRMTDVARAAMVRYSPVVVISGMALGWDTAVALAALDLKIPLVAAVPFKGQESKWAPSAQAQYRVILSLASKVEVVCPGGYSAQKMNLRNEWMVDNSTHILALWNGKPGGTGNCVRYAQREQKPIINVYSSFQKYSGLDFLGAPPPLPARRPSSRAPSAAA